MYTNVVLHHKYSTMHPEFVLMHAETFSNTTLCQCLCSLKQPSAPCIKCSPSLGKMPSLTISHASQQINELPKRERECRFSGSNGKLKMANHSESGKLMKNVAEAFLNP